MSLALPPAAASLNHLYTPKISSHFPTSATGAAAKVYLTSQATSKSNLKPLSSSPHSLHFTSRPQHTDASEVEDHVLGDCIVFEEGIFDDPFAGETLVPAQTDEPKAPTNRNKKKKKPIEVKTENLIPDKWLEAQREVNITKKERRKLLQQLEFGTKVERRRQALRPIGSVEEVEDYAKRRDDERLKQLNSVVLNTPDFTKEKDDENNGHNDDEEEEEDKGEEMSAPGVSSGRVTPRNPRLAVYGGGFDDITEFFNGGAYDPNAAKTPKGTHKLFSKEEKLLANKKIPDLVVATSGKWHPLHTLAASGEFYLVNSLLKHNININVPDKNGLTAIHRAILGKKQAIFSYLLRESANPFVRDTEGATLMHYAVRTASSQMIKILLLYNVDINLQDDYGWTPLHLAIQSRRTDLVRLLLIKGADKTLRNQDGLTPLDLCLHSSKDTRTYELIKLLKQLPRGRLKSLSS